MEEEVLSVELVKTQEEIIKRRKSIKSKKRKVVRYFVRKVTSRKNNLEVK